MPTLHMLAGLIGAGKTTLARRLERELSAVRFSLDEWIMNFYGHQAPEPMQLEWWLEHGERCTVEIWRLCPQLFALDIDVIFDFGFLHRPHRDRIRALAASAGVATKLYVVSADTATRRARIEIRNRTRAETFALVVTDDMFDSLGYDEPTADELVGAVLIENG